MDDRSVQTPLPGAKGFGIAAAVFLGLMAVVAALFQSAPDRVAAIVRNDPRALPIAGAALVTPLLAAAVALFRAGAAMGRTEREDAASGSDRGRLLQALAIALGAVSILVPVLLGLLAQTLHRPS